MGTKFSFLIAVSLGLPLLAHASDEPSPEEVFRLLCDRQAPRNASQDDRNLRSEFQKFLRNPELTARALDRSLRAESRDVGSEIELVFLYSQTCFLVHTHSQGLASKGCRSGSRKIDASRAKRACAPVISSFEAASRKAKAASEPRAEEGGSVSTDLAAPGSDADSDQGKTAPAF